MAIFHDGEAKFDQKICPTAVRFAVRQPLWKSSKVVILNEQPMVKHGIP